MTTEKNAIPIATGPIAMPQSWSSLVTVPTEAGVQLVSALLDTIDTDATVDDLQQLVQHDLSTVTRFLAAVPYLDFFAVIWDHREFKVFQSAGPNRRRVLKLLQRRTPILRLRVNPDEELCEAVGQATQIIADELHLRAGVSFAVLLQVHGDRIAELLHSGDMSREQAWESIRLSLPEVDHEKVPVTPPPSHEYLTRPLPTPATPSRLLSAATIASGIRWHEYQRSSPFQTPDWRWDRAWAIVRHHHRFSRRRDDAETGRAVYFLRGLHHQQETLQAFDEMPEMLVAHDIWKSEGDRRLELEARILARQTDEEIADHMKIEPEAVRAFGDTFYDVRAQLDAGLSS